MIRHMLASLACLSLAAPAIAEDYPPAPPMGSLKPFTLHATETFTLPNGMKITLIPFGSVPQATISLNVFAGRLDAAGRPWLAELTGDMLKEGAGARSSAQIADAAAAMGGNVSVGTGTINTALNLTVLSEHASDAIALLADLARAPTFPASEFGRAKDNRVRSLSLALSQAQPVAELALGHAYYGDHPYGATYPTSAQLGGYTLADVRAFHAANFGAQRAHLYIAGRFDTAAVRAAVSKAFGGWAKGPARLSLPPTPKPGPQFILVDRPGAPQSTIRLAFPGAAIGSTGDFPLRVMDTLLSGSFNSRITRNIRENKGYTYSPGSQAAFHPGETVWVFQADVTSTATGASLHEIFSEIRTLQATPPGAEETAGMATYRATDPIFNGSTAGGLIGTLAQYEALNQPPSYIANYVPRALAVTPAQISAAARATLPLERMTLVVVGDLKTVLPQLKAQPELAGANFVTVTLP